MRIERDLIVALRYKLRMFGVPLDGLADVMRDNQLAVNNKSLPQSNLGKKHNAVNFMFCERLRQQGSYKLEMRILRQIWLTC